MAEAIEINFPREKEENPSIDPKIKNQILDYDVRESEKKKQEECPKYPDMSKYIRKDKIPCWGCKL